MGEREKDAGGRMRLIGLPAQYNQSHGLQQLPLPCYVLTTVPQYVTVFADCGFTIYICISRFDPCFFVVGHYFVVF